MKFWAIAYLYQEDVFFDFGKGDEGEDVLGLEQTCLLPTKQLALEIINNELGGDYVPVKIELETLNKNGTWVWSRDTIDQWDS